MLLSQQYLECWLKSELYRVCLNKSYVNLCSAGGLGKINGNKQRKTDHRLEEFVKNDNGHQKQQDLK